MMNTAAEYHGDEEGTTLDIVVILDRSGSMQEIRDDAIGSFNAFLTDKKQQYPLSKMSIVLFDDRYDLIADSEPIGAISPLNGQTYVPRGSTALLDAIGLTVAAIEARPHTDEEMLVAVLTDGYENASTQFRLEQIRAIIQEREKRGWDFVYLSADPGAFSDAGRMGFERSKIKMFDKMTMREAYYEMEEMIHEKQRKMQGIKRQ